MSESSLCQKVSFLGNIFNRNNDESNFDFGLFGDLDNVLDDLGESAGETFKDLRLSLGEWQNISFLTESSEPIDFTIPGFNIKVALIADKSKSDDLLSHGGKGATCL